MTDIYRLYRTNKDEWLREYFPEFYAVFGGYPKHVRVTSNLNPPWWAIKVEGVYWPPELEPWKQPHESGITVNGTRKVATERNTPFGKRYGWKHVPVTEEEYRAWCDSINYFKTGQGLDPSVFIGAYRLQDRENRNLDKQYLKEVRLAQRQGRLPRWLRPPSWVTCPSGIYLMSGGPAYGSPYGVNASFHPNGQPEPSWISDKWGPDNAKPEYNTGTPGIDYRRIPTRWIKNYPGTIPDQETYDRERYLTWSF